MIRHTALRDLVSQVPVTGLDHAGLEYAGLPVTFERVCAVDVAKGSGMVCVRHGQSDGTGRRSSQVWEVPATTEAVTGLAGQLDVEGLEKVTIESTSDYWRTAVIFRTPTLSGTG